MQFFGWNIAFKPAEGALEIVQSITLFEILSVIGFTVAIWSLFIAVRSAKDHATTRRAEFSFRVWQAFMDDEVQRAYLDIEWNRFAYPYSTSSGFESEEQERRIDKLLYLLDEMALLIESRVLPASEKERWSYQGIRVFKSEGVRKYLEFLDKFFAQNGLKSRPHDPGRRVFGPSS